MDDPNTVNGLTKGQYIAAREAHREISELARQLHRLANRYEVKDGPNARMIAELMNVASYTLGRVNFSDVEAVEVANGPKG